MQMPDWLVTACGIPLIYWGATIFGLILLAVGRATALVRKGAVNHVLCAWAFRR